MHRLALYGLALAALCAAITAQQEPAFEVASVKPSAPVGTGKASKSGRGSADPGLFTAHNRTLKNLIIMAYGVQEYQVSGGPGWMESDRFDIDAKPAADATREQMLLMLRTLLADRFQLKLHHDTKPLPALALTVARNGPKFGPKFHRVDQAALADLKSSDADLGTNLSGTMTEFAFLLRSNMRMIHPEDISWGSDPPPILDQTHLAGSYAIYVRITGPKDDLPAAIESQLGLRLDPRKIATKTVVIDSAVRPSGN